MFIGHFGVALGLKSPAPRVSLGTLFLATQFADLLWATLLLLGLEHAEITPHTHPPIAFSHFPFSHSLLMMAVAAVTLGGGYYFLRRRIRGAVVCGVAVLSHWLLDLIVHSPDLPLSPGFAPRWGLGLWHSMAGALLVELTLFALGVAVYAALTRGRDRVGRIGFWALVGTLLVIQFANTYGGSPPSITAVAWAGQAQWLLVLWAYWIDAHREPIPRAPQ